MQMVLDPKVKVDYYVLTIEELILFEVKYLLYWEAGTKELFVV